MDQQSKNDSAAQTGGQSSSAEPKSSEPWASPGTDPTNPHNQEGTGEWTAHGRASDRRNSEPGLTDRERERRKT